MTLDGRWPGAMMAVAPVASRTTGLVSKAAIVAVIGAGLSRSAYTVANTLLARLYPTNHRNSEDLTTQLGRLLLPQMITPFRRTMINRCWRRSCQR